MKFLLPFAKLLTDFALPPRCPICGVTVEEDHKFCMKCWSKLDFLNEPWCVSCGKPFAFAKTGECKCAACLIKAPQHDGVRAAVAYDDHSALLAMRLKYGARIGLADLIADHLCRFVDAEPNSALIIPVPLHRWRLWSRGFNQSVLIGRSLSKKSGLAFSSSILRRNKATPPLRSMSAARRMKLVKNAFSISDRQKDELSGREVLLIDDVYTTGSTANACARSLKNAGASGVRVLCWARVLFDDERN